MKKNILILLIVALSCTMLVIPALASGSGQIAFSSDRSGNNKIWMMDADGNNPVQLTMGPSQDSHPALSPDGTKIAFVSDDIIQVMNIASATMTVLTDSSFNAKDPAWSPDGTKIAFMSDNAIWVTDADGYNMIVLADSSFTAKDPAWSPDGTKIAFVSDNAIWVMDANGYNMIALTDDQSHASQPTWSRKPASNVPEFPSVILPATMIIGFLGAVMYIQRTTEH